MENMLQIRSSVLRNLRNEGNDIKTEQISL